MYEEFKGIGRYWNLLVRKLGRAKPSGITCSFLIFLSSLLYPASHPSKPPFYIRPSSPPLLFFLRRALAPLFVRPELSVSSPLRRSASVYRMSAKPPSVSPSSANTVGQTLKNDSSFNRAGPLIASRISSNAIDQRVAADYIDSIVWIDNDGHSCLANFCLAIYTREFNLNSPELFNVANYPVASPETLQRLNHGVS